MNTAGFHLLRFYPTKTYLDTYRRTNRHQYSTNMNVFAYDETTHRALDPDDEEVTYIKNVCRFTDSFIRDEVLKLFGLNLDDFNRLANVTINTRKYQRGFSYLGYILIGLNSYKDHERLTFEVNGRAFDHLGLDVEALTKELEQNYSVTALHAKIDTTALAFKHLYNLGAKGLCTAAVSIRRPWKSSDEDKKNPLTLPFGTIKRGCQFYEAGKFHDHIANPGTMRLEVKLESHEARHFFSQFREAPANLEKLIKSHVVDTFGVKFHTTRSNDKKISRRPLDKKWSDWVGAWEPVRWEKPQTPVEIAWEDTRKLKESIQRCIKKCMKYMDRDRIRAAVEEALSPVSLFAT